MRTTIRLDEKLLMEAKETALYEKKSLNTFIAESVREKLQFKRNTRVGKTRYKLKTVKGDGLMPGVDLDNSASVLDLMEQGE